MLTDTGRSPNRTVIALISLLVLLAGTANATVLCSPHKAEAAVRRWGGGHDVCACSEPSRTFYFAEGTTRNGFEEYLCLGNPGDGPANVSVSFLFPEGEPPTNRAFTIQPSSTLTLFVNDLVGSGRDVSLVVEADTGIVAERPVFFNYRGVWTGSHNSTGAIRPSRTFYFAEGCTREGFDEWLCLQNPNDVSVSVGITYMLDGGETVYRETSLGPSTRATLKVDEHVGGGRDVAIQVSSDDPIVAERPVYFDHRERYRGGHTLTGVQEPSDEWHFAEGCTRDGFEEWLSVQNPGGDNHLRVSYFYQQGEPLARDYYLLPHSRTTICVNEEAGSGRDVAVTINADHPVVAERPEYFSFHDGSWEGGHTLAGLSSGSSVWWLSPPMGLEGESAWLCIANHLSSNTGVTVSLREAGTVIGTETLIVPAHARRTIDLRGYESLTPQGMIGVSSTSEILVERPVYHCYHPAGGSRVFPFGTWDGLELACPVPYHELTGIIFHEAAVTAGDGQPNNAQVMQPLGKCLRDDNPMRLHRDVDLSIPGEAAYWIEETRGRGTYSTTACDVQCKAGTVVCAPVSGTVTHAEAYDLYGRYPDLRVKIIPDGRPHNLVVLLHLDSLSVSVGQRVSAGETPVGTVRDLVPYFHSGPNPYTREEGNHVHLQINYRP